MTGATGFVGRHLLAEAQRRGHDVVVLVRERSDALEGVEQFEIGDMAERDDWSEAVARADAVIHLAARVHMMRERGAGLDEVYERCNTESTIRLARAAADAGVRRFVFASSIKVNGERTTGEPFTAASPAAPVDPYGRSKHRAEELLSELAAASRLGVSILRPTVVYGPGAGGNIQRIAGAVRRGMPLPLGAVRNRRSMIAVQNLVTGILAAAEADAPGVQTALLADPAPISTRELVEHLAAGLGVRPRLVPVPVGLLRLAGRVGGRAGDVDRLVSDLEVIPDWAALGVDAGVLLHTGEALRALGAALGPDSSPHPG